MKLHKTARYRVKPEMAADVEKAMHEHAKRLKEQFPGLLWWTIREKENPSQYLTLIIAADESTNQQASNSEGTSKFVALLYPNLIGEIEWTDWEPVAYTFPIFD